MQIAAAGLRRPPLLRGHYCAIRGDTTVQVATPPTASEFRGGIIGVTLRPVSGADIVSLITDEHFLHSLSIWETQRADQKLFRILKWKS